MRLNVYGPIFGTSGYNCHVRNLFNSIYELNPEIHLDTALVPGYELLCNDAELNAITNPHYDDGVTVFIGMPPLWPLGQNNSCKAFYGYCVWEGDKIPVGWMPSLVNSSGILVPSAHVKEAIKKTVLEMESRFFDEHPEDVWKTFLDRIFVVPHGVDTQLFQPRERSKDEPFTFLANKGWAQGMNDRGGLQYVFQAFAQEFGKDEPVRLKVKINPAYCPQGWDLGMELKSLGLPEDRPEMLISTSAVDYKGVPRFYDGDVFLNPTMGEAFSIPCAEAMAMGVPVITTGYGGQTDYVNNENGWLIDYDLFEVEHDVMYEGVQWARPRIDHLRKLMRYAYAHRDEVRTKGLKAREDILRYSWRASAEELLRVIKEDADSQ